LVERCRSISAGTTTLSLAAHTLSCAQTLPEGRSVVVVLSGSADPTKPRIGLNDGNQTGLAKGTLRLVELTSYEISSRESKLIQRWLPLRELERFDLRPQVVPM